MRDDFLLKVGQCVRYIRIKKGISQEDLAYKAGLSQNSLSTLERGLNNIKLKNLYNICRAMDCDLIELLSFKI